MQTKQYSERLMEQFIQQKLNNALGDSNNFKRDEATRYSLTQLPVIADDKVPEQGTGYDSFDRVLEQGTG